ncbi:MAG: domain protein beta Propeller [Pedosphaera sp.]|nr:domain protein beta Propeller [Pedosphaera sp.]
MNKPFWMKFLAVPLAVGLCAFVANAQDDTIHITKPVDLDSPPTPIAISGFSGEVARALNFDLTVMGFVEVPPDSAKYALTGNNNGSVQGQLSLGKNVLFSKIYNGGSSRAQAHRLADDVVMKLTGVNGIAETKIAFKAGSGQSSEIYIADFDGHNPQAVTSDRTTVAAPCWVPGKLALYYTSYKLGNPDVFYQNLSSGERQNFAHYPGMNSSAAVSPDGRKVALVLSKSGSPDIYVRDIATDNLKQITTTREASSPCWSPDGNWICFAARVGGRRSLYKVPAGGGQMERISTSGISNPSEPDWSPDGKWIAFTAQMGDFNLCVVPAQGGSARLLVSGEDPSWAPNSRTLIFVRRGGGGSRVLSVLDVPTKQVKDAARVSGGNSSNSQPSWAR